MTVSKLGEALGAFHSPKAISGFCPPWSCLLIFAWLWRAWLGSSSSAPCTGRWGPHSSAVCLSLCCHALLFALWVDFLLLTCWLFSCSHWQAASHSRASPCWSYIHSTYTHPERSGAQCLCSGGFSNNQQPTNMPSFSLFTSRVS